MVDPATALAETLRACETTGGRHSPNEAPGEKTERLLSLQRAMAPRHRMPTLRRTAPTASSPSMTDSFSTTSHRALNLAAHFGPFVLTIAEPVKPLKCRPPAEA